MSNFGHDKYSYKIASGLVTTGECLGLLEWGLIPHNDNTGDTIYALLTGFGFILVSRSTPSIEDRMISPREDSG